MFKSSKKNEHEMDTATTILGKGMRIEGALVSGNGILRIEGDYQGEIRIDGELFLEKSGFINGNIGVTSAYVSGCIKGNVKCLDLLHITSSGKVNGDIECEAILMDEGAIFIGCSKMTEREEHNPLRLERENQLLKLEQQHNLLAKSEESEKKDENEKYNKDEDEDDDPLGLDE